MQVSSGGRAAGGQQKAEPHAEGGQEAGPEGGVHLEGSAGCWGSGQEGKAGAVWCFIKAKTEAGKRKRERTGIR